MRFNIPTFVVLASTVGAALAGPTAIKREESDLPLVGSLPVISEQCLIACAVEIAACAVNPDGCVNALTTCLTQCLKL